MTLSALPANYDLYLDMPSRTAAAVSTNPGTHTLAVVTWRTDEPAASAADYGTISTTLTQTVIGSGFLLDHRLALRPLSPDTTYYFQVRSADAAGNVAFLERAVYFTLIGWWFSGLWMLFAYLCLITLIGIPLAFWMYGRVGAVATLYRS